MATPWDDNNIKANLNTLRQLQANERLRTTRRKAVLPRFERTTKTIFSKEPPLSVSGFQRPLINVFKRAAELATRVTIHQGATSTKDFDSPTKITKDMIKGAFSGLLVLAETYRSARKKQQYTVVKSLLTDITKSLRKIGGKKQIFRGGWNDRIRIDGRRGTIVHKITPKQMETMLRPGMQALLKNTSLCNEATTTEISNLNPQWLRAVYGSGKDLMDTYMPATGQIYRREGTGICGIAAEDWRRSTFRHPSGSINPLNGYLPFGNQYKGVDTADSQQIKAVYNDVGRNSGMLFALSQLTTQAIFSALPFIYLAFNGDDEGTLSPVLTYKNIGIRPLAFDKFCSRIKKGGGSTSTVVVEGVGEVNVDGMAMGIVNGEPVINCPLIKFGIEGINFQGEVSLEWKRRKSRTNQMKISQKAIKGEFSIQLNRNIDQRIQSFRPGGRMLTILPG